MRFHPPDHRQESLALPKSKTVHGVLVTGSHYLEDLPVLGPLVEGVLTRLRPGTVVIDGDAPGVDTRSRELCEASWRRGLGRLGPGDVLRRWSFPAPWEALEGQAGPVRNRAMLGALLALREQGHPVECHAFPGPRSRGTWDMVDAARKKDVVVYEHGPWARINHIWIPPQGQ